MLNHARAEVKAHAGANAPLPTMSFMPLLLPSTVRPTSVAAAEAAAAAEPAPHAPEHYDNAAASESEAVDPTDEDVANEHDSSVDVRDLGTGHFSPIQLAANTDYVIDVHREDRQHAVTLWKNHQGRNQEWDINHFGQVYW